MNTKLLFSIILFFLFLFLAPLHAQRSVHSFRDIRVEDQEEVLSVEFRLPLHKKSVGSVESVFLLPVLEGDGHRLELPYIWLDGKGRCKAMKRAETFMNPFSASLSDPLMESYVTHAFPQAIGSMTHYRIQVPFEEWMEKASLVVHEEVYGCAGKRKGVLHTLYRPREESQPVSRKKKKEDALPRVSYVAPRLEEKHRSESGSAYLDFPQGQSLIQPSFRNNRKELQRMEETIEKTRRDRNLEILDITIAGYASPEGSYQSNERLSWERAQALRSYLQRNSGLSSRLFDVLPGGEDWQRLREMVKESGLPDSPQILSIIDSRESYDRKEARLRGTGSYEVLLSDFYPTLRRVDYRIDYRVRDFSVSESHDMLTRNPDHLSPYELYEVAGRYPKESDKWNEIIELTVRLHPGDEVANINAAGVLLNRGDLVAAKICLDKVWDLPGAWNNLGVYYLYTGDLQRATEYFTKAIIAGVEEASWNMDIRREMELYMER
ncbi:MAG: OmpA family protein [Tannerellaceae bacterium]|nr:OmpA family protein [Tannerellaceae bacterium]